MIAIGCDHGGYLLKESIIELLQALEIPYQDFGCFSQESVDYPVYAFQAANAVASGAAERAILICTTGIGISIAANKIKGIRAAVCTDHYTSEMTRRHNNANVLCLGAQVVDVETAKDIVTTFLNTSFEGGKHQRRVDMISAIETGMFRTK